MPTSSRASLARCFRCEGFFVVVGRVRDVGFEQLVGIAFEASSAQCAARVRQLVSIATTHDLFAVASEAVTILRRLASAPSWALVIRSIVTDSMADVPVRARASDERELTMSFCCCLFVAQRLIDASLEARSGASLRRSLARSGTLAAPAAGVANSVDVDHALVWRAMAALCVAGCALWSSLAAFALKATFARRSGTRDSVRLGGRVLVLPRGISAHESTSVGWFVSASSHA